MTPERFDQLARLWAAAPSRRAFLLQLGGVMALSWLARTGIRLPALTPPRDTGHCFKNREGMACRSCGLCQNGQCIGVTDGPCQTAVTGPWAAVGGRFCSRCDPDTGRCKACAPEQTCCKDGCCDGKCAADGACCPEQKLCGEDCCRGCEECLDGRCVVPSPKAECEKENEYRLEKGCCVCRTKLCGGECCDKPCLGGKCCEYCGLDNAVCCDGRKCCRERCVDPAEAEKCCDCWEDISEQEGQAVLERARTWAAYQQKNGIKYKQDEKVDPCDEQPKTMDCSYFVQKALGTDLLSRLYAMPSGGRRLSTRTLDGECELKRLPPKTPPRAGDILAQPRSSGEPGSQHTGVATGQSPKAGGHYGIAMGNSGGGSAPEGSVWGALRRIENGWFEGGDHLRVYRPQKRKNTPQCKGKDGPPCPK